MILLSAVFLVDKLNAVVTLVFTSLVGGLSAPFQLCEQGLGVCRVGFIDGYGTVFILITDSAIQLHNREPRERDVTADEAVTHIDVSGIFFATHEALKGDRATATDDVALNLNLSDKCVYIADGSRPVISKVFLWKGAQPPVVATVKHCSMASNAKYLCPRGKSCQH